MYQEIFLYARAHARRARIGGLATNVNTLNRIHTSEGVLFKASAPLEAKAGRLNLYLPGRSLVTLMTLPVPGLKPPPK